jgi:hypothetical protein
MKPTKYGKSKNSLFTIEIYNGRVVTPMCIFSFPYSYGTETEIYYRYNTKGNTVESDDFEYISRAEFYKILREIEIDQKIKITVKMGWK